MKVCFAYAAPSGFSGQFWATKLLLDHLPRSIERVTTPLPAWSGKLLHLPTYGLSLVKTWLQIAWAIRHIDVFYINAGQTMAAIVRDGICLAIARVANRRCKRLISFHGNVFTLCSRTSFKGRLFAAMCNRGDVVTVLGPNQKASLISLGVHSTIQIVDNASEMEIQEGDELERKHEEEPLQILSLGNLLESKGYPIFLEALAQLAKEGHFKIRATLAGDFIRDSYPSRFNSVEEAEKWVTAKVAEVNASAGVRVEWIRGVAGVQKTKILRRAQGLVFASSYPVEAQPFVLLEALASGVSILTSRAGEISTTLNDECALFLPETDVPSIVEGIKKLRDRDLRIRLARNGVQLFRSRYSLLKYIEVWTRLICER